MSNQGFFRPSAVLALAFFSLCLAALGIIALAYKNSSEKLIETELEGLAGLVDFKVQSIGAWLNERRANAYSASSAPAVAADLDSWLNQDDKEAKNRLNGFLRNMHKFYGFSSVALLLPDGQNLLVFGDDHTQDLEFKKTINYLIETAEPQLLDIHRHTEDSSVRLGFVAPIFNYQAPDRPLLGALLFGMDASKHLYPLLERWPEQGSSIEIGLMRMEGEDIVYLSPMRHKPETLLTKRHVSQAPKILSDLVMTQEALPYQGESVDYLGRAVLVAGQPVLNTPWHLLIKKDKSESLEGLLHVVMQAGVMAFFALTAAFALLNLWWQRSQIKVAKEKIGLVDKLRESEENYRTIFSKSKLPALVIEPDSGSILNANEAAVEFYGYSLEQLLKSNISDLNILDLDELSSLMAQAKSNNKNSFDFRHRLASGEIRDVEVFSGAMKLNNRQVLFSVLNDVTERKRLERKLQEMATTDALTGLPNRRCFLGRLQETLELLTRGACPAASLLMLDLDRFKNVNDTWGHAAGDQVLQQVACVMREQLRKIDIPGRLGGEEFAILLPGVGADEARISAERLRQVLANSPRTLSDGTRIEQTISIGITELLSTDLDVKAPLSRADRALYQAKAEGRNRTIIAQLKD